MDEPHTILLEQLKLVRGLAISSFGFFAKDSALREAMGDEEAFGNLSRLVHNAKRRYDSHRVLVQTVPTAGGSDLASALAESFIDHITRIYGLMTNAGLQDQAVRFAAQCELILEAHLSNATTSSIPVLLQLQRATQRAQGKLAEFAPLPVCYWYMVRAAAKTAQSVVLTPQDGFTRIVREIRFPPEYQQAGISVLSYFSVVIAEKYPGIPVSVSITQEGVSVTMVITLPDGRRDQVTKALNDYGLVVTGQRTAKSLLPDDFQALALQQKLELANLEVRQARDLLHIHQQNASGRIDSLEREVSKLYDLLGRELTSKDALTQALVSVANQVTSTNTNSELVKLVHELAKAISSRDIERTKVMLEDISSNEPELFARMSEFLFSSVASGVIGNAAYDWLKFLWPILPK